MNSIEALYVSNQSFLHHGPDPFVIPSIRFQAFLKDFMEDMPKDLGPADVARGLDAVLEHGAPLTGSRIRNDGGRDEVVRVQDNHVLGVVHDALSAGVEVANQVDI